MKKVAVQPFLQYKQVETKDSIKKQFLAKEKRHTKNKDYEELMEEGFLTESLKNRH